MRRTILSLQKNAAKFITPASISAAVMPERPATTCPMNRSSPVRAPSSNVVFIVFI
jgi:hypothetical protein